MLKNKKCQQLVIKQEEFEVSLADFDLPKIITMDPSMTFLEAARLMKEKRIGSMTLGNEGKLSGIFTERDCISKAPRIIENPNIPLSEIMTENPLTLSLDNTLLRALSLMSSKEFRHIPLVNESGLVEKMISIKDILKFVSNYFQEYIKRFDPIDDWKKENIHLQEDAILYDLKKQKGSLSEEIFDVPLKRIYTTNFSSFDINMSIEEALLTMHKKRHSIALVFEFETELKGVFTERDILYKVFAGQMDLSQSIGEIMTAGPHVLTTQHQYGNAFKNMFTYGYRNVPIVNQEGFAIGNVSLLELLIFLAGELGVRNVLQFVE